MLGGRKISVQRNTEVADGQGGFLQGWAVIAEERGRVRPATGKEMEIARNLQGVVTHITYLRAAAPVQSGDRLLVNDITLRVHAIRQPALAGRFIAIDCEELQ